jgi:hypothetical protein
MVLASLLLFGVSIASIRATTDDFNGAFLEGAAGTYLSVAYLSANALSCVVLARSAARADGRAWRWTFALLLGTMALVIAASAVLFVLGDVWHDRHMLLFHKTSLGRKLTRLLWAVALAGIVLGCTCPRGSFARFWVWLGTLLYYLSLDDLLGIHEDVAEHITRRWWGLPKNSYWVEHLNDWLVVSYGLGAIGLFLAYRRNFLRLPWTLWTLGVALLAFIGSTICDFLHTARWIEETQKALAGALILAALGTAWLELRAARLRGSPV